MCFLSLKTAAFSRLLNSWESSTMYHFLLASFTPPHYSQTGGSSDQELVSFHCHVVCHCGDILPCVHAFPARGTRVVSACPGPLGLSAPPPQLPGLSGRERCIGSVVVTHGLSCSEACGPQHHSLEHSQAAHSCGHVGLRSHCPSKTCPVS